MNKAVPEDVSKISRTFTFQDCIEIEFTKEDISRGIEWQIQDDRHAVIVHLEGNITELDTEIDGCLFSPARLILKKYGLFQLDANMWAVL